MDNYTLDVRDTLLLYVDLQERLVPVLADKEALILRTNILLEAVGHMEVPVIVTEQYPKGLGQTVESAMAHLSTATFFEKTTFSSMTPEVLQTIEKEGRRKILIVGAETHICVFQTARDLIALGYQVFVLEDGVSSRSLANKTNALRQLVQMGATVTNLETVLYDLLKKSGGPVFKQISQLVKSL